MELMNIWVSYIQTNRLDLAKERLEVLKNCKCKEYEELKELIEKN